MGRFNQEQKEALARIPPERLLLETDAPFCPVLASGAEIVRRPYSTPYTIDLVATCVGRILKKTRAEVLKITTQNAQRFFQATGGALVSGRMERVAGEQKQPVGSRLEYISTA